MAMGHFSKMYWPTRLFVRWDDLEYSSAMISRGTTHWRAYLFKRQLEGEEFSDWYHHGRATPRAIEIIYHIQAGRPGGMACSSRRNIVICRIISIIIITKSDLLK